MGWCWCTNLRVLLNNLRPEPDFRLETLALFYQVIAYLLAAHHLHGG